MRSAPTDNQVAAETRTSLSSVMAEASASESEVLRQWQARMGEARFAAAMELFAEIQENAGRGGLAMGGSEFFGDPRTAGSGTRSHRRPAVADLQQWYKQREPRQAASTSTESRMPTDVRNMKLSATFSEMLNRLQGLPTYKNNATRPILAQRVCNLLELMAKNPELKQTLEATCDAAGANKTCNDRVALTFSNLEILARHHELLREGNGNLGALAQHVIGRHRLDLVNQAAQEEVEKQKAAGNVDDVEVILALQAGLKETLGLPIQVSKDDTQFLNCAKIDDEKISQIAKAILDLTSTIEAQLDILARDTVWREAINQVYGADRIQQDTEQAYDELEARYEGRDYDQAYNNEVDSLGDKIYRKFAMEALQNS